MFKNLKKYSKNIFQLEIEVKFFFSYPSISFVLYTLMSSNLQIISFLKLHIWINLKE